MAVERARIAFGPEALSRFDQIIEEVSLNLVDDGLAAELVKSDEMRRKLAKKLLGFARLWWTDTQIKQLLLRTARNQISASRQLVVAAGGEATAENVESETGGRWAMRSAYLGVDKSQPVWRKPLQTPEPSALFGGRKCDQDGSMR